MATDRADISKGALDSLCWLVLKYAREDVERTKTAMSDPYDELYPTKREACEAGKYLGATDMISRARSRLSQLSAKYERDPNPAKFHAIEECCGELRKIAEMIEHDRERMKLGGNH